MTERTTQSLKFGTAEESATPKSKITAKTESKTLVEANRVRIALYVTNVGANAVWLALGPTAVAEEGPMLAKEGGAAVIDNYLGIITAITKSGESVVSFSEV